jgi:antitoxin component YwqK of YwqJK toxin-antitoxin module
MRYFIITVALLFNLSSYAQQVKTYYHDNGKKASEGVLLCNDPKVLEPNFPSNYSKDEQERILSSTIKDGEWKSWYDDGTLQSVQHYNKGVLVGKNLTYHPNGQLESLIIPDGVSTSTYYYMNGQKQSEGILNSESQAQGIWKGWFESGVLNFEAQYSNGLSSGVTKWYSEDGKLYLIQEFSEGNLIKTTKN